MLLSDSIACIHANISKGWIHGKERDEEAPQYTAWEVGMADAIIEILEWCGAHKIKIGDIILQRVNERRRKAKKRNTPPGFKAVSSMNNSEG